MSNERIPFLHGEIHHDTRLGRIPHLDPRANLTNLHVPLRENRRRIRVRHLHAGARVTARSRPANPRRRQHPQLSLHAGIGVTVRRRPLFKLQHENQPTPPKTLTTPLRVRVRFHGRLSPWLDGSVSTLLDAKAQTSTARTATSSCPSARSKTQAAPNASWSTGPTEKAPPKSDGGLMGRTAGVFGIFGSTSPRTLTDCARTLNTELLGTGQQRRSSPARACGWCLADLTGRKPTVKYCNVDHKTRSIAARATEIKTCGWCGVEFSGKFRAKFCSRQHMKNAGSRRFREENQGYYARYSRSPTRLAYNQNHIEQRRAYARARGRLLRNDPEYIARRNAWWAANRQRKYEYNRKRRALLRGAESVGLRPRDWQRLLVQYQGCCAYCLKKLAKATIDHVVPVSRSGRHAVGNVVPACRTCNSSKHDSYLVEWRRRDKKWKRSPSGWVYIR